MRLSLVLLAIAIAATAHRTAAVETWIGTGESKRWNDGGNWASGRAPVPTTGLTVQFESPDGASFGFGGTTPVHFGRFLVSSNSGPVFVKGPGLVFGGSVNSEPEIGFVPEDLSVSAILQNASSEPLVLRGGVKAGWDLIIDATNGPIRIEGGLDPAGRILTKKGDFPLEIEGGAPVAFSAFESSDSDFVLDGADVALPWREIGSRWRTGEADPPAIELMHGATLRLTNRVGALWFRAPIRIGAADGKQDASTLVANGERLTFNRAPSFAPGACITNAGPIAFAFHPTSDIPRTIRLGPGARLFCDGIWLGGNPELPGPVLDRTGHEGIRFLAEGPEVPTGRTKAKLSAPPVLLDLGGGNLCVGGWIDSCRSSNAVVKLDGAAVLRTRGKILVPTGPWRSDANRLVLGRGVHVDCDELSMGGASSSNRVTLRGCTVSTARGGVYVGYGSDRTGVCEDNRLELREGARLLSEGPLKVGRGRRGNEKEDSRASGNAVVVRDGSRLATAGAEIAFAESPGPVFDSSVTLDGAGSRWDLGGHGLVIGRADSGMVSNAFVSLRPGTLLTNASELVVGSANASTAQGCRLLVQGARVFTSGNVFIGRAGTRGNGEFEAVDNSAVVAGRDGTAAVWDFGNGSLRIGQSTAWRHMLRRNHFELRPGGRLKRIQELILGGGTESTVFTEEAVLELRGGTIEPVQTLRIGKGGVLSPSVLPQLGKLGTTPIEVLGDIVVEKGAFVRPVLGKGMKPRLYPVLRWKGAGKGVKDLALAPDVDASRWKLHVDEEKKQVLLQLQ